MEVIMLRYKGYEVSCTVYVCFLYKSVQILLKFDFLETMISEIRGFDLQRQSSAQAFRD